jgi:hypothetical protein
MERNVVVLVIGTFMCTDLPVIVCTYITLLFQSLTIFATEA